MEAETHYNVMVCDKGSNFYKLYRKKKWALKKAEQLHKKAWFVVVEEYVKGKMENVWWFDHKYLKEEQLN